MPKNQTSFTLKGNLDISDITKGIEQLRAKIQSSELGTGLTAGLTKDLNAIQKKFETAFKNLPGVGATSKQVDTFATKIYDAAEDLNLLAQKMKDFGATDKYIKENIGSIQKFANALSTASRKAQEVKAELKEKFHFQDTDPDAKIKTIHKEHTGKMRTAANAGDIDTLRKEYNELTSKIQSRITDSQEKNDTTREQALVRVLGQLRTEWDQLLPLAEQIKASFDAQTKAQEDYTNAFQKSADNINTNSKGIVDHLNNIRDASEKVGDEAVETAQDLKKVEEANNVLDSVQRKLKDLFSVATVFTTIRRVVRGAIQDFQELDKQFNEIAIVSNYSTKEMWQSFSDVNKVAQEFGVTTKNVLEVQNLYYHQGKDMAEVNKLTAQTLTLAKITGMDYERATSDLTAALNAYNIAAEDAVRVTDTIAAMDTNAAISSEELMTALTKTASIAANAGMSLESTEVFLTKMIETTREAPENLGTALKTIIARFGEVKQEIDGQEIELADINRVDTALKSIGISLLDTAGQIRDLDGVFMELSSKWDGLDRNTQRYIATIAAGSRQQSRFIAMMEDYDRTLELTEIAQNSAGLGAKQLAKSMESIETSVNRLKSTWQEFYSGFITSGMIKGVLDLANAFLGLLNGLNKISPVLTTVVLAFSAYIIKTQVVDGLVKNLGQSFAQGMINATADSAATDKNTQSKGLLATVLSTLNHTLQETTNETNSLTKASLANAAATNAEAAAVERLNDAKNNQGNTNDLTPDLPNKKSNLEQKGWAKDGRLTDKGREILQQKRAKLQRENPDFQWKNLKNNVKDSWMSGKNKDELTKILGKEKLSFVKDKKVVFNKEAIKNLSKQAGTGIKSLAKKGLASTIAKIGPMIAKIAGVLSKIGTVISTIVGTLGGPLTAIILGIVAAIAGAVILWKKFGKASLDDTKQVEKLQKAQEKYNNSLKEYNDLKEKAKVIEKYRNKKNLSEEQLREEQEAAKALVDQYPELLNYIDEEGRYWLKDAEAIQKVIDAKEELLDQDAVAYGELRLKYAKEGIYADTTTQAGKAMQSIQTHAATYDEDQLKESADRIDAAWQGILFNGDKYEKIMTAFAEGKKFSFDEKDMSNLFAGQIGETNWNEFLDTVAKGEVNFEDVDSLAEALDATGAYAPGNAEEVAEAFIKMNEENGQLFSRLIEGAAQEYSEIEIQQANIQIAKGDFAADLSTEVTDAISAAAVKNAKEEVGEGAWEDLDPDERIDYVKDATQELVDVFEALTKSEIKGINAVFTASNIGSMTAEQLRNIDTRADQKQVLKTFWEQLSPEIQRQFPKEDIDNLSAETIGVLFGLIVDSVGDVPVDELINGLVSDFEKSKTFYIDGDRVFDSDLSSFLSGKTTLDQIKAFANTTSGLSEEQLAPYVDTIITAYNNNITGLSEQQQTSLKNKMIGTNFMDVNSVISNIKTLRELGLTTEEVADIMMSASHDIANVTGLDFESVQKSAAATIETFSQGIEGMGALIEGTASFDQMSNYLNSMKTYYTELARQGDTTALASFQNLQSSIVATGKGFKVSLSDANAYGQSLYDVAVASFDLQIALLKQKLITQQNSDATQEEIMETASAIMMLEMQAAQLDAQIKQTRNDKLIKNLEKAKEKADELVNSLKELVDWLMKFDRFDNLNRVSDKLEDELGHLEYEINFSTNSDVIKKDYEDIIKNINTQIAANQGGLRAAEDEKAMRRDVIEKNYSNYVSFDANGTAIVNAQKMQQLQEEISKADESRKQTLQAEADLILDSVEAYNKAEDAAEEYSSGLEDNFSKLEEVLKEVYQAEVDLTDKLIEVRQEQEDKELEMVKDKYEAIKDENDKYLDSIRDMIDEERRLRDRADREQDVKDKEKKLAMMKMDTSGIYANDIRALEKELEGDYRGLEDDAVDQAINEIEKTFEAQAEALDKEIEYLENTLQYKREKMTEYNDWAINLVKSGSDEVYAYLKANDQEYITATDTEKKLLEMEWTQMISRAEAAHELMGENLVKDVGKSLEICKESAQGFEGAVKQYSQTALASNGQIEGSVEDLTGYYTNLALGVEGVTNKLISLKDAYNKAADAARNLKAAQDYEATGNYQSPPANENNTNNSGILGALNTMGSLANLVGNAATAPSGPKKTNDKIESPFIAATAEAYNNPIIAADRTEVVRVYSQIGNKMEEVYVPKSAFSPTPYENNSGGMSYSLKMPPRGYYYKFAKGGYVDYTGPAWVDGTKSHPEYMLNAAQTQQFETLVAALSSMFSAGSSYLPNSHTTQKTGDAVYNFHINVDQMSSDYDVDQLIERIEKRLVKAGQYRNVTMVRKTNN